MNQNVSFISSSEKAKTPYIHLAFLISLVFGLVALLILIAYSVGEARTTKEFLVILGMVNLIALASVTGGGIIGFLFGIPHYNQNNNNNNNSSSTDQQKSSFTPSTNLEQIADWLTKILVGVGLVQIHKIIQLFNQLCNELGQSLSSASTLITKGSSVAGGIIVLFSVLGFLVVYLWTYVYLIQIQDFKILNKIKADIEQTDINDKNAIDLANMQLNLSEKSPDIPIKDLVDAFSKASQNIISSIFFRAVSVRKEFWNHPETKFHVEKTIPIFRALIQLDSKFEYPMNYAELGFALKDKGIPDYQEAFDNLDKAIKGFKNTDNIPNLGMIYFNRAYCRIKLINSKPGEPTDQDKKLIRDDLAIAMKTEYVQTIIQTDKDTLEWLKKDPLAFIVNNNTTKPTNN